MAYNPYSIEFEMRCDTENLFREFVQSLGYLVTKRVCGKDRLLATDANLSGSDAYALLDLCRAEGFDVQLSTSIWSEDSWSVVLVK